MTRPIVLVVLFLLTGIAHADNPEEARKLYRIGASAYRAAKFDAAAQIFDRAWELHKAPELAFAGAQSHRLQYQASLLPKHLDRAIELFEAYVGMVKKGGLRLDALAHLERLRDIRDRLAASGAKTVVEVVEKEPPPSIYVSTALENALITIDDKPVERYTSIEVAPGDHVVAVSADGHVAEKRTVTVTKGQAMVPIELVRQPATLMVASAAGSSGLRVLVDGREVAGARSGITVEPGERLVTVYARGREPVTQSLELRPGQALTLDVPLRPTLRRRAVRWVGGGAIAMFGATLVTGTVSTLASFSASDLRDSSTPLDASDTAHYERLRDRRDTFRSATVVLGGATLAMVGVALWLYYFDTPSPEDLGRPSERKPADGELAPLVTIDDDGAPTAGISFTRSW